MLPELIMFIGNRKPSYAHSNRQSCEHTGALAGPQPPESKQTFKWKHIKRAYMRLSVYVSKCIEKINFIEVSAKFK